MLGTPYLSFKSSSRRSPSLKILPKALHEFRISTEDHQEGVGAAGEGCVQGMRFCTVCVSRMRRRAIVAVLVTAILCTMQTSGAAAQTRSSQNDNAPDASLGDRQQGRQEASVSDSQQENVLKLPERGDQTRAAMPVSTPRSAAPTSASRIRRSRIQVLVGPKGMPEISRLGQCDLLTCCRKMKVSRRVLIGIPGEAGNESAGPAALHGPL